MRKLGRNAGTAIPADPEDLEDRAVSEADLKRALMARRIRQLRNRLGLSQSEFASRFGIPLANIRQYEIGRTMPPPAVQSYLRVIEAKPDEVAEAISVSILRDALVEGERSGRPRELDVRRLFVSRS